MKKIFLMGILILLGSFTIQPIHAQKDKKTGGLKRLLGVHVDEIHDKFDGSTTYRMKGNKVKIKGAVATSVAKGILGGVSGVFSPSIMTFRLQLENHIKATGENELGVILKVTIKNDASFWPMEGESLIFLADGKRIGLSTEGSYNNDPFSDTSRVSARYLITQELLETIIRAKKVEFRLIQEGLMESASQKTRDKGETNLEGEFNKKNFQAWQDFYENYIVKTPKK